MGAGAWVTLVAGGAMVLGLTIRALCPRQGTHATHRAPRAPRLDLGSTSPDVVALLPSTAEFPPRPVPPLPDELPEWPGADERWYGQLRRGSSRATRRLTRTVHEQRWLPRHPRPLTRRGKQRRMR